MRTTIQNIPGRGPVRFEVEDDGTMREARGRTVPEPDMKVVWCGGELLPARDTEPGSWLRGILSAEDEHVHWTQFQEAVNRLHREVLGTSEKFSRWGNRRRG